MVTTPDAQGAREVLPMQGPNAPLTQPELTALSRRKGAAKVRSSWKYAKEHSREALTKIGNATVRQLVDHMMDMLVADWTLLAGGRTAHHGSAVRRLKGAPVDAVCIAAVRAAVNGMTQDWTAGITLQTRIGSAVADAILDHTWNKLAPDQAKAVRKLIGHKGNPGRALLARRRYAEGWAVDLLEGVAQWDDGAIKAVGALFAHYLVLLEMLQHSKRPTGQWPDRRKTNGFRLTERAMHWVSNAVEFAASSAEIQYPTVEPPIPWTAPQRGGFHGRGADDHPAIPRNRRPFWIVRGVTPAHKELLLNPAHDLSTVYAGLNAAQRTPWRINRRVFDVFGELRRSGLGDAGLAVANKGEKPPMVDAAHTDREAREAFLAERRDYYAHERKEAAKRRREHYVFDTAKMFKERSARFYFVHNLDFRGRVYACSDYLSPQGGDLERGLLEFAEGDALTADGVRWLKIHLANTYGLDKVSFDTRIKWAEDNARWFCGFAEDPIGTVDSWGRVDSPWQFLAACFAWRDYEDGVGPCHLPVTVDGSCSGIQHCAALVADAEAGARVNLVPRPSHEKPADIYGDVAQRANELLQHGEATRNDHAHRWLRQWEVTRADTKSSVMTLPYGGLRGAHGPKIRESIEKQIRKGKKARPAWLATSRDNWDGYRMAIKTLDDAVWQAMAEIVAAPMEVMRYVQSCARALQAREVELKREAQAERKRQKKKEQAAAGPHLRMAWISPCGFPVLSDYRKEKDRRTEMTDPATGKALRFTYYARGTETDWREVAGGAVPNFVHSLDASHLLRSIARAREDAGVGKLGMVHDSFSTTPSKMGALVALLADEFARMYSEDVLEATLGRMLDEAGAERPKPPVRGELVISDIAKSPYLFA